jgi:hypothetical protein
MNLKRIKDIAGKAAARAAKIKIGMYWVGIPVSPEILTHESSGNHSSFVFVDTLNLISESNFNLMQAQAKVARSKRREASTKATAIRFRRTLSVPFTKNVLGEPRSSGQREQFALPQARLKNDA